ncbi:SusC/RagA family TonB-linked outer membrane protein [Parabacteroides sp. OttesenSCG-928-G06]|nr:SusC/RagA family TonB-linked outer membrane protein [Parabacteroides sp. OttesenSCG-928-G06]
MMRNMCFLILLGCQWLIAATSYSQSTKLSLDMQQETMKNVFAFIEQKSEYIFFYSNEIDVSKRVSVQVADQTIDQIMDQVLKDTPYTYLVSDRQVYVKTNSQLPLPREAAQKIPVSGVIVDATGEPVIGANIVIKNQPTVGVVSDVDGKFSIEVEPNTRLQISYIGFVTQEVVVTDQTYLQIILLEDAQMVDEVVVVGYGVQKKINMTGSVASVLADKIESRTAPNLSSMLSGLASGVTVRQSSGNPGSDGASIRIRGVGTFNGDYRSPLVVIDGAVADMNSINPEDVESVSVLKDAASASIYGARGANGVILVSTKKGAKNAAPRITYTGAFTQEKASGIFEFLTDYADYMELYNMAELSSNPKALNTYDWDEIAAWRAAKSDPNGIYTDPNTGNQVPNYLAYPNTNWSKLLFAPNYSHKHTLSISGGSQNSNYLMSLGYYDNPGTLENTGMDRFNMRINAESQITKFLKVGTQTYGEPSPLSRWGGE